MILRKTLKLFNNRILKKIVLKSGVESETVFDENSQVEVEYSNEDELN